MGKKVSSQAERGPTAVDKSVRLVLIVDAETVGRQSVSLQRFFVGLAAEACSAALVCPPECNTSFILSTPVEIMKYPIFKLPLLWHQSKNKLIERLEKFKPTVLHCLSESKGRLTKYLAGRLNLPYVLTISSVSKQAGKWSISPRRCATIIAPSQRIASDIVKIYPNFAERVKQINMGTFVEDTCACFSKTGRICSMVVAEVLDDLSDFEALFNAIKHLAVDGYGFVLMIIGGGRGEHQIRKFLEDFELSRIVNIVPDVQPLRPVFIGADIFIQLRPKASFNFASLEAMSAGMAVAAAKGGADDDLLIDGKTAVVFDPEDELSIYGCLRKLLDERERTRQIAMAAQNYLRQNYTVTKMTAALLDTYGAAQKWLEG